MTQETQQLRKQLEKAQQDIKSFAVERERFQDQLEKLVQELERREADLQKLARQQQAAVKDNQQDAELAALRKQVDDRQKSLDDLEKKLKKRKEKLDQMEVQLQHAAQAAAQADIGPNGAYAQQVAELRKKCADFEKAKVASEKEVQKIKEDSSHSQAELERLLQIMSNMEEEKFTLNNQIKELQDSLRDKEAKLNSLRRNQQVEKTRSAQMLEEARRREGELSKDASKAQEQITQQIERIAELEEAIRESVEITAESEISVARKEAMIRTAEERIGTLQAEVRALQNVVNARCTNCPPLQVRLGEMENELRRLVTDRRRHLEECYEMKQEALSAALSEKDAHLALLEVSGIKNAQTATEVDKLRAERKRLVEKMKTENDRRMKTLAELAEIQWINGKAENIEGGATETGMICDAKDKGKQL